MCALIDASVLSKVFNPGDAEHEPFKALMVWVTEGNGAIVYGGSTYKKQLGTGRYLKLFHELRVAQRAFLVDGDAVDRRENVLKGIVHNKDFDDAHLLAIIAISKCCLLCTGDVRLRPYFRRKDLYPDGVKIPKIYTKSQGRKHCSDSSVVGACPRRSKRSHPGKKPKSRPKLDLQ